MHANGPLVAMNGDAAGSGHGEHGRGAGHGVPATGGAPGTFLAVWFIPSQLPTVPGAACAGCWSASRPANAVIALHPEWMDRLGYILKCIFFVLTTWVRHQWRGGGGGGAPRRAGLGVAHVECAFGD